VLVRWLLVLTLLAGCSATHATMVRNLGIGLTAEGVLVGGAAYATHDSDEGISDAATTAAPLLATGIAAWIAGEILIGLAKPARPGVH
jgi:hypothetical protein